MNSIHVEVDGELVAEVKRSHALATDRDAVEFALRSKASRRVDATFIRSLEGLGWDGDLAEIRSDMGTDPW